MRKPQSCSLNRGGPQPLYPSSPAEARCCLPSAGETRRSPEGFAGRIFGCVPEQGAQSLDHRRIHNYDREYGLRAA
jgi:hypothetical protein